MSEYDEEELMAAIENSRRNPSFSSRGLQSLDAYARMVGVRTQVIQPTPTRPPVQDQPDAGDDDTDDGGGTNGGGSGTDGDNDGGGETNGGGGSETGDGSGESGDGEANGGGETDSAD